MKKKIKIFLTSLFIFWFIPAIISGQILNDTTSLKLVKEGIDNIYNLRLSSAEEACRKLKHLYPEHPVNYLLEGLITYWRNFPMPPASPASVSFENDLRKCIELCGKKSSRENEAEYLLANLSARGMLLLYFSDNNLTMDVIPLAVSTYQYIRRSFNYTSVYPDFFFFTGLYNYSREAYPETYPVYKPVALLFPKGNRVKGQQELLFAARNSILFKAEAYSFLSGLNLSFEQNFMQAYNYSKSLHELYPHNNEFLALYIKNLLLIKRYDEAEKVMITEKTKTGNSYFNAQLAVFRGILQEKKYFNDRLAEKYYTEAVKELSFHGHFGNEYSAYSYFGLSRISRRDGNLSYGKTYHKKAFELADFKDVSFDN